MATKEVMTARLLLRPPRLADAEAIFARYASLAEVTRYLSWPRHTSIEDTRAFVQFSQQQWRAHGCGPYLIWSRDGEGLLGSTGLMFESGERATAGYVLAPDAWGRGHATEALRAMIDVARSASFRERVAGCHVEHRASARAGEVRFRARGNPAA
jgi:ribosomal-protein-alanine N-acetyltransferase